MNEVNVDINLSLLMNELGHSSTFSSLISYDVMYMFILFTFNIFI